MKFTYSNKLQTVYCPFDPAIDFEKSNIEEYQKTRDESLLVFKPGATPVKFILKNIPKLLMSSILNQGAGTFASQLMTFGYAVDRIENLQEWVLAEDVEFNSTIPTWEPDSNVKIDGKDFKYCEPNDVVKSFAMLVIADIAMVALKKTQSLRGMKLDCPILPTSTELIQRVKRA